MISSTVVDWVAVGLLRSVDSVSGIVVLSYGYVHEPVKNTASDRAGCGLDVRT
jgi:hypothetical protein